MKDGLLLVDKPRGISSHAVVAVARKRLGTKTIGHAGTLDPMATGLLVLLVGEATKLALYATASNKSYRTTVALGSTSDTLDALGSHWSDAPLPAPVLDALASKHTYAPLLQDAIENERKRTSQIPPSYSAIHVNGKRAYAEARKGNVVELAARPISVERIEVLGCDLEPSPWIECALDVSKGYYIRSFARDLAQSLGTVGHASALRRMHSAPFSIDEATTLEEVEEEKLIPLEQAALRLLPDAQLTSDGVDDARKGKMLPSNRFTLPPTEGVHAWFSPERKLVAIGQFDQSYGKVVRGFR